MSTEEFYNETIGIQDVHIKNMHQYNFNGEYLKTRTINIAPSNNETKKCITLCDSYVKGNRDDVLIIEEALLHYGYKNIKFYGDMDQVRKIQLIVGGQQFDCIYPSTNEEHRSFYLSDEHTVPALEYHKYDVVIEFEKGKVIKDIQMKYDVYVIDDWRKDIPELLLSQCQYCGLESANVPRNLMPFNHPMQSITVLSTNELFDMRLELETYESKIKKTYTLEPVPTSKGYKYICLFTPPVNFSRLDRAYLYHKETSGDIHIFGKSLQVARFLSGMAGLCYSK